MIGLFCCSKTNIKLYYSYMNKDDIRRLQRCNSPEEIVQMYVKAGMALSIMDAKEMFDKYCVTDGKRIRHTLITELPKLLEIFAAARKFMKENGNPDQWGDDWPSKEILRQDIEKGQSYVVVNENNDILATFAYIKGIDPTYIDIKEGKWLSDEPYGTIHRLASSNIEKDMFSFIVSKITTNGLNMRVDTHANNKFMINALLRNGFIYCGLISPIEGGIRVAYEKIVNN